MNQRVGFIDSGFSQLTPSFVSYPGMDLNGVRRKNATRETTSTLKAWLYEHRKNPYPTKGEKIMLAIVTKMTLTQGMPSYISDLASVIRYLQRISTSESF